jgi:hypothetical protein
MQKKQTALRLFASMKRMHCSVFCSPSRERATSVTGGSVSCGVVLFRCGCRLHWDDLMICLILLLRDKKKVSLHLDSSFTYPEHVAREFSMDFTDTLNQGMMVCCPTDIIQIPNNNKPREVFVMITSDAVRFIHAQAFTRHRYPCGYRPGACRSPAAKRGGPAPVTARRRGQARECDTEAFVRKVCQNLRLFAVALNMQRPGLSLWRKSSISV